MALNSTHNTIKFNTNSYMDPPWRFPEYTTSELEITDGIYEAQIRFIHRQAQPLTKPYEMPKTTPISPKSSRSLKHSDMQLKKARSSASSHRNSADKNRIRYSVETRTIKLTSFFGDQSKRKIPPAPLLQ